LDDTGVCQRRDRPHAAFKPFSRGLVHHVVMSQDFECDVAALIAVTRHVHRSGRSRVHVPEQFKPAKMTAR
jgi:hypothetical protein